MVGGVSLLCAVCALLVSWLIADCCFAQHASLATAQSELTHFALAQTREAASASSSDNASPVSTVVDAGQSVTVPSEENRKGPRRQRAWMFALAGTGAAFATSFVLSEGLSARYARLSARDLERSRDIGLDLDARNRARRHSASSDLRADILERVSDVCLGASVAATGAALLIWLTGRRQREDRVSPKTLLGPMVLRGASGGGLVLREKF